jgi:hypothetical protein
MRKLTDSKLTTSGAEGGIPKQDNRTGNKVALVALTLGVICSVLVVGRTAQAQDIVIKEVGRAHLASVQNTTEAGKVRWSLVTKGTRNTNVKCTVETEFTNSTSELLFRLTDFGGLSGDPACQLDLMVIPTLKNNYTFEGVSISTMYCGNPPCTADVVSHTSRGSNLFEVIVKGGMKGIFAGFPNRRAIFRVHAKVKGPANQSPF